MINLNYRQRQGQCALPVLGEGYLTFGSSRRSVRAGCEGASDNACAGRGRAQAAGLKHPFANRGLRLPLNRQSELMNSIAAEHGWPDGQP
jgi:hypothetical protein